MADICLVIPPSIFLLDERVFPSLGVLKIASNLERAGYKVDVLDLSGYEDYTKIIEVYCTNNSTENFGITTTTPQMPATYKVANAIRQYKQNSKLIIGGPHPTLISAALKLEKQRLLLTGRAHKAFRQLQKNFDVVVSGDGELAIFDAINAPRGEFTFIDADDPKGQFFLQKNELGKYPWPARHLIDLESYHYKINGHKATSLIGQLGCPFSCAFCGGRLTYMLRMSRQRDINNIVDEMKFLYDTYQYTGFMFYDDELNVNKQVTQLLDKVSDLQDKLGVDFALRGFVKAEIFTEEQARAMYRAGFRQLLTGFESGDERILININKKATIADNSRAIEIAKKNKLTVKALMSIGHAGESHQTIENTKNWLLQMEPEDFDCTVISTYPGTSYYDESVETEPGIWTYTAPKTKDRLHAYDLDYNLVADYYKGDPNGGYKAYVYTDHISAEHLVTERDKLEKEVREKLNIPFNSSVAAKNFEHSMGMNNCLTDNILRTSK